MSHSGHKELLGAETSAVFLMEPDQKSMRAATALGKLADALRSDVIRIGEGIIGGLARDGRPRVHKRYVPRPAGRNIPGTPDNAAVERLMATPLLRGDQVTGMMAVWRSKDPFSESDLNFLNGLARQASIALDNARLFAEIQAEKQFSKRWCRTAPSRS